MILIVYFRINKELFPPPPEPANQQQQQGAKKDAAADNQDQADQEQLQDQAQKQPANPPQQQPAAVAQQPRLRHSLGSLDPQSKSLLVVYFDSRGAAVERVELVERDRNQQFKYRNLLRESGYLGHLALSNENTGGCRINLVVPGSPAAQATSRETPVKGLAVGDIITRIGKHQSKPNRNS